MAWFAGSRQVALERVIGLVGDGRGVLWWWRSGSLRDGTTRRDGVDGRHTDIRGLGPHVGDAQEGAPD
jgi:hypothetical protein